MRVVFMGTPALAATVLEGLIEAVDVVAVFTRPDAVRGRGRKLVGSPVKEVAEAAGLPVFTPSSLRGSDVAQQIRAFRPDALCVAAYGMILPKEILEIAPLGSFNVHSSLLPRWRGAAPIERALLAGDEQTGVCIMLMEEGLDTGPFCKRAVLDIDGKDLEELSVQLAQTGSRLMVEALEEANRGTIRWTAQPETGITYASKIEKGELDPDPNDSTETIIRKVRASSPAHPSKATIAEKTLTLEKVADLGKDAETEGLDAFEPGQVAFLSKRLFIVASDGAIELLRVKPDGKSSMDAKSFAAGIQGIKNRQVMWGRR